MSKQKPAYDETVFTLPVLGRFTYDEAHATLLGGTGAFAGLGVRLGFVEYVAAFTFVAFLVAFGFYKAVAALLQARGVEVPDKISGKAADTIRREAWYFVVVYLVSSGVTWYAHPLF